MISGCVIIDLDDTSIELEEAGYDAGARDRRRLDILNRCPDGARVLVRIGRRRWISPDAARWLKDHEGRLQITIEGYEPESVLSFVLAARAGEWPAAA